MAIRASKAKFGRRQKQTFIQRAARRRAEHKVNRDFGNIKIGLALSGGGVRAAIFHLGVLLRLADGGSLNSVAEISTVSGGSLVTALIMSIAELRWPTATDYREKVYPEARRVLTTTDLLTPSALGWSGLFKYNFRIFTSRARILADLLAERWGVGGRLRDLPDSPTWWINTACFETGKNWRFAKRHMGDWKFGRHYNPPFSIAEAAAASAAVPYVIGALALELPSTGWYETDPATRAPLSNQPPPAGKVRLWDGGAYENLGLETIYKPDREQNGSDFIICSDASGPLSKPASPLSLLKGDLASPRLFDIASDQIRSLRSRMFVQSLGTNPPKGALLRLGNSVRDLDIKLRKKRNPSDYDHFLSDSEVKLGLSQPTNLSALAPAIFDRIARNGYEVADITLNAYAPTYFPKQFRWSAP